MKNDKPLGSTICIDLGSTVIKYMRFDHTQTMTDAGYFGRDYTIPVGLQAQKILDDELGFTDERDVAKICSSANGGLKVGIIAYTKRYSANYASLAVMSAGANVLWAGTLADVATGTCKAVDLLLIVGKTNHAISEHDHQWLTNIAAARFSYSTVLFAGNTALQTIVPDYFPKAICVENIMQDNLRYNGDELINIIRNAYINDLVQEDELHAIKTRSLTPVLPTPAIVEKAYGAIMAQQTDFCMLSPMVLLDIGGATTDMYYGGELIADNTGCSSQSSTNRHVYTNYGIAVSRERLLEALANCNDLTLFLQVVFPDSVEEKYMALRDRNWEWVNNDFLAEACFFMALSDCRNGERGQHHLQLAKTAVVCVTGGASQLCNKDNLQSILAICGAQNTRVLFDSEYRIWIEGMKLLQSPE